jgi:hypothetical protein
VIRSCKDTTSDNKYTANTENDTIQSPLNDSETANRVSQDTNPHDNQSTVKGPSAIRFEEPPTTTNKESSAISAHSEDPLLPSELNSDRHPSQPLERTKRMGPSDEGLQIANNPLQETNDKMIMLQDLSKLQIEIEPPHDEYPSDDFNIPFGQESNTYSGGKTQDLVMPGKP